MAEFNAGFKVYADSTAFEKGMAQVTRTSENAGKAIARAFDGKAIVSAIMGGIGFSLSGIIDQIAEGLARTVIGFSKKAQEDLEELVKTSDKAADAQEKRT